MDHKGNAPADESEHAGTTSKPIEDIQRVPVFRRETLGALSRRKSADPDEAAADEEANFQTPEEVAADDTLEPSAETPHHNDNMQADSSPKQPKGRLNLHLTRKQLLLGGPVVILLVATTGVSWFLLHRDQPTVTLGKPKVVKKVVVAPKPTTVASTLSGLQVDPAINETPVTGVMIENSVDARPQSGLSQANVVFEAVAEGGVTRFLALFQDMAPGDVGPIRSARPYYIQWLLGFDAAYAHVGGSPAALEDISAWGVKDMNQFSNGGSYHRISTRKAPHNVYTGISNLNDLEKSKGYTSSFTGFPRKAEAASKQVTARTINVTMSGPVYNSQYIYNATKNSYDRSEGGSPHLDANGSVQISPKVVVTMVVPKGQGELDSSGAYYSDYQVIGSGVVHVFQDGIVTTGTWSKADNNSQIVFTDSAGKPLKLNPGQTWITAVSKDSDVSYTP